MRDPSTWHEDERAVYDAIVTLNAAGRSTNASQVSARTGLSRQRVVTSAGYLRSYGAVRDVGKGSAYNWRAVSV